MTTAVIYARYSSSGQREESIEGQVRECSEYAERRGYRVLTAYTDKALTGRTDKRPGFQQMIRDAEKQIFDIVVCWKTDRFARNRYDAAMYKARLRKCGVKLEYARETVPEGAEGIILESVLQGMAEYYSENLAENVRRGFLDSALKHKAHGRRIFGYDVDEDDMYIINQREAEAVRAMFDMYLAGSSQADIAEHLRKICPGKIAFSKSFVSNHLRNDAYIGMYRFKDIADPDVIPAIVDRETFMEVQTKLSNAKNKRRQRKGSDDPPVQFLLTGKIYCGLCGEPMTGDSSRGKDGAKRYYYTCRNKKARRCNKRREPKQALEDFVTTALIDLLHTPEYIYSWAEECVRNLSAENPVLTALEARKADTEKKIQNVTAAIMSGTTSKTLVKALESLEADLDALEDEIRQEQLNAPLQVSKDEIVFYLEEIAQTEPSDSVYRMRLVDYFLNAVYVYEDKIVLYLNMTSGNSQVTYEKHKECSDKVSDSSPSATLSELIVSVLIYR